MKWLSISSNESQPNADLVKGLGDTFGNYLLHGIEEVKLPEAVSWWPQAIGWKILFALLLLWLVKRIFRLFGDWRANRYRRLALKKLSRLQAEWHEAPQMLRQLPLLLKTTALQAYPRSEVAQLSGQAWLALLDSKCSESTFNSELGQRLLTIDYQNQQRWQLESEQVEELLNVIRVWIKKHRRNDLVADHV